MFMLKLFPAIALLLGNQTFQNLFATSDIKLSQNCFFIYFDFLERHFLLNFYKHVAKTKKKGCSEGFTD